ncbi:MAG: hypothetical protein IKX04_01160 [Clostridiales bacterium]|nr:hypothetical protein [Clostridiales bacterium]MBR5040567.1 hypothetical protein [Clostridiales bacterium]MBR5057152.1 hypothetical protein [Clostridiales bacterium]
MPQAQYPEHDINQVFDYIHTILSSGNVADNALDEMSFLNRLFAALPVQAVEYGMQFLHGKTDLPKACDEILPLYIRFVNLVDYCEAIDILGQIPSTPSPEELKKRIELHQSLEEREKSFCRPLLGFAFNNEKAPEKIDPETVSSQPQDESETEEEGSSNLHLMDGTAPILVCADPLKTSSFYETHLGFHAAHLDDESMPHIRLVRDNIEILLVKAEPEKASSVLPVRELYGIPYDLFIYCAEPMLLQMELKNNGVKLIKTLEDADTSKHTNREFVIEDIDGRHICISQRLN